MRTDKIEMGNRQNLEFSSDFHLSSQVRKITCIMIDSMSDMHQLYCNDKDIFAQVQPLGQAKLKNKGERRTISLEHLNQKQILNGRCLFLCFPRLAHTSTCLD